MTSDALKNHYEVQRLSVEKDYNMFKGLSVRDYACEIGMIIKGSNVKTMIDYGCGQAYGHQKHRFANIWRLEPIKLFDPGYPEYSEKPTEPADMVICIDVLEHVPEELLEEVLDDINFLAKKIVFLTISTRPASKRTIDGKNAHLTVKPKEWWEEKLKRFTQFLVVRYADS